MSTIVAMLAECAKGDPDKSLVIAYIGESVAKRTAIWDRLQDGSIEVRLISGEIYIFGKRTILRLA